jgi:hypothetical protein
MAAYFIVEIEVTDPTVFEEYRRQVSGTIEKYGGRYTVRGGTCETIEGGWAPKRVVVLEFARFPGLDGGVWSPPLGQHRVAEVLDADVMAGVQCTGDASGETVELHPDEAHGRGSMGDEVADPTAWLQHKGVGGHPHARQRCMHRLHDHGRGIEGGKGGAPGAGVVLRRQEGLELVPQLLPAGVFVLAGDRVWEEHKGHRAEAGEAGEHGALLGGSRPLGLLDGLERADRRQDGAGFGFLTGGRAGRVGALWRYVAVVGGSLVEVHVVDKGRVWYGREGHGASLL